MMRFVLFLAAVAYVGADSDYWHCSENIVATRRLISLTEAKPFIKKDAGCQDGLKELLDGTACGYLFESSFCYHCYKKYKELTYDQVKFSHISGGVDKAIELGKTMCNHGGACYAAIVDFVSIKMCVDWKKVHAEGKALLQKYVTAGDSSSPISQALLDMLGERDISNITKEYEERKEQIEELFEDYKKRVIKLGSGFCEGACLAETGEYVKKFMTHLGTKCTYVANICQNKCKTHAAHFLTKMKKGNNKDKPENPVPCCLSELIEFGRDAVDDASKNTMLDGLFSAATDFFGKYDIGTDCFNKIYGQAHNKCKKDNEKN